MSNKEFNFILETLMERIAREYFTLGQETPKGGMTIAGDSLYGIRHKLKEKYIKYIEELNKNIENKG